jgi:hypothetical protein
MISNPEIMGKKHYVLIRDCLLMLGMMATELHRHSGFVKFTVTTNLDGMNTGGFCVMVHQLTQW